MNNTINYQYVNIVANNINLMKSINMKRIVINGHNFVNIVN